MFVERQEGNLKGAGREKDAGVAEGRIPRWDVDTLTGRMMGMTRSVVPTCPSLSHLPCPSTLITT